MRVAQYVSKERAISAADKGGIRERWQYGLRLLRDPEAVSPNGGGLRHGVAQQLIEAARARGMKLSAREIQWRIQCARAYPTDSQIRNAVTDFETWHDLIQAGFPAYEPDEEGEPVADHRTPAEVKRSRAVALLDLVGEQGALFPLDRFEPVECTLKDLIDYAVEQAELTARFSERDRRRADYLAQLREAVGDDLSCSWEDAHRAAFPDDDGPA